MRVLRVVACVFLVAWAALMLSFLACSEGTRDFVLNVRGYSLLLLAGLLVRAMAGALMPRPDRRTSSRRP